MLKTLGILFVAAIIVILELPHLLQKKLIKEVVIFSILLAFGVILSILLALGVKVPNPMDFITYVLKPLTKIIS
ncbi:hypothetical protein [Psychrobacillus sp. OK032]|uniref:hypothetical protein n=1 Tax=Psychrobacillus sp. OK032 TaxID=1884358 RepID=UPI0008CE5CFC|nr:hypothetical protein [Psychrobacillus sp. OK032]SES10960.1 hypothetical protein SAMN05518872_104246 [Psychrobacillus sp. OK032]